MNTKKLLVSFLMIASVLVLASAIVSATVTDYDITQVTVDGIEVDTGVDNTVSVTAGELVTVKVWFTSNVYDTDVTVEAELEGDKVDSKATVRVAPVEENDTRKATLTLKVPYELKDELKDTITLNIKIDGKDSKAEKEDIELRVQRVEYNADIKSISAPQSVDAGETFPVDIVLKNIGYNNLDDIYVTASIPALALKSSAYLGDIVALECDEDDDEDFPWSEDTLERNCDEDDADTVAGRLFLKLPFELEPGIYALEVEVTNDDTTSNKVVQIAVNNDFTSNVIVTSTSKTVAVGENAEYNLLLVNPTDKVKVYRVVTESSGSLSSNADEAVVAVPAGASKTVIVTAKADAEGDYNFNVNVFSGEKLLDTVTLKAKVEGSKKTATVSNPVVVLTVILAIIFLVLLIVLIVLIGKKPEKSEEFGESYY